MVVTARGKAAVRYKLAIDKYIAERTTRLATLVAFSGEVADDEYGPEHVHRGSMNPDLKGRTSREAFASPTTR